MQPLISLIIPVYNSSNYLGRCLQSVLSQSLTEFEVILINDGSTDNSGEICKKYSLQDNRIKYYNRRNEGVSATRQFGIEHSSGIYSIQIDSDDWIDENYLKDLYETAIKTKADLVYAPFVKEFLHKSQIISMYKTNNVKDFIKGIFTAQVWGGVWNKLLKMEIITKHQIKFPSNIKMWEDLVFISKYLLFAKNISYCENSFYHYTLYNANSLCATASKFNAVNHMMKAVSDLEMFYKKYNNYEILNKSFGILKQFSKQKLLFSRQNRNINKWITCFPESNIYFIHFLFYAIKVRFFRTY